MGINTPNMSIHNHSSLTKQHVQTFHIHYSFQVVDFAKTNGDRITSRQFGVDESNVRLWKKSKLQLDKMPKSKRANRGRIAFYPNLEKQIIEWITDCRSQGIALNTIQIRLKAKLYAKDMNIVDFKASYSHSTSASTVP